MRTYGETNLKDIARCFSQLSRNNFVSASENSIIPFTGYNEFCFSQNKNGKLYDLGNQEGVWRVEHLQSQYDQQLYYVIRNAINSMANELISNVNGNTRC